ncbi:MAG: MGMT family protein [Akkermansiaceae bacterium]
MPRPPTDFEQRVYAMVRLIPQGRVVTYKTLAQALGCRSTQAVGQALKRNPYAPEVPCHRVIRADLTLGGYAGAMRGAKLKRKRTLLEGEGVEFDQEGRLQSSQAVLDRLG